MGTIFILIGAVYAVAILAQLRGYLVYAGKVNAETGKLDQDPQGLTAQ